MLGEVWLYSGWLLRLQEGLLEQPSGAGLARCLLLLWAGLLRLPLMVRLRLSLILFVLRLLVGELVRLGVAWLAQP